MSSQQSQPSDSDMSGAGHAEASQATVLYADAHAAHESTEVEMPEMPAEGTPVVTDPGTQPDADADVVLPLARDPVDNAGPPWHRLDVFADAERWATQNIQQRQPGQAVNNTSGEVRNAGRHQGPPTDTARSVHHMPGNFHAEHFPAHSFRDGLHLTHLVHHFHHRCGCCRHMPRTWFHDADDDFDDDNDDYDDHEEGDSGANNDGDDDAGGGGGGDSGANSGGDDGAGGGAGGGGDFADDKLDRHTVQWTQQLILHQLQNASSTWRQQKLDGHQQALSSDMDINTERAKRKHDARFAHHLTMQHVLDADIEMTAPVNENDDDDDDDVDDDDDADAANVVDYDDATNNEIEQAEPEHVRPFRHQLNRSIDLGDLD